MTAKDNFPVTKQDWGGGGGNPGLDLDWKGGP